MEEPMPFSKMLLSGVVRPMVEAIKLNFSMLKNALKGILVSEGAAMICLGRALSAVVALMLLIASIPLLATMALLAWPLARYQAARDRRVK